MACRLVRELKLGLFVNPMTSQAASKIVFRDLGIDSQQSGRSSHLRTHDDGGMDSSDINQTIEMLKIVRSRA
jgi:hypothetical protein